MTAHPAFSDATHDAKSGATPDTSASAHGDSENVKSVAVIMAAGVSKRFGAADKRLAALPDGRRLLAASVAAASSAFPALRVVLREGDDPDALGLAPDTPIIRAPRATEGLGASIGDAFTALAADAALADIEAAAILLGDMPALRPATLNALKREAGREHIVRPVQAGRPGHPVLFGRAFWAELAALGDSEVDKESRDQGAKSVIRANRQHYLELSVDDPGIHLDIDRAGDLERLS
ncbi:NTP transferase domain-containing protein [Halomonas sp. YLGW01]|uniref:nucleotidyltransferase family protein n=1 Tax=Halomonas sp. YLGW01 TaxID=2773308 RepID=UPI001782499D|nr:NTP transferase domain-containing protein [Halomonas sp. YLGW01]